MLEIYEAYNADFAEAPQWVQAWVSYMSLLLMSSILVAPFRPEARWTLVVLILTLPAMMWLYAQVGFVRLLGLVHVVLWTPLLVYLWMRRAHWRVRETIAGKWTALVFVTILISLLFDYTDVVRYITGDRGYAA